MARIRDLWHKARPSEDEPECGEHTSKTRRMVATSRHGVGRRWQAEWTDPDRNVRTEAFDRNVDAETHLAAMKTDVQRGEYIDPRAADTPFETLATEWFSLQVDGAAAGDRKAREVAALIAEFGKSPIGGIRTSRVRSWQKRRAQEVAASTTNNELRTLKAIFRMAVEDDLIRKNPCDKVRALREDRPSREVWPAETIAGLIDAHPTRCRAVPILCIGVGARSAEAQAVGVDDVGWLTRQVSIERQIILWRGKLWFAPPKFGSVGVVPACQGMLELLSVQVAAFPPVPVTLPWLDDNVIQGRREPKMVTVRLLTTTSRGNAMWRGQVTDQWRRTLQHCGIEPAGKRTGLHMLRHAYATYLIYAGVPLLEVQRRMRHRSMQEVTTTYAHVLQQVQTDGPVDDQIAEVFRLCSVSVPEHGGTQTNLTERIALE